MNNQMELAKNINVFNKGISLMSEALSYITDKGTMLLNIINDGYPQDRYANCFSMSFDDEALNIGTFAYAFEIFTGLARTASPTKTLNEYEGMIVGFKLAEKGLAEIVRLSKEDEELKKVLVNFMPKQVDENDEDLNYEYNPFKLYGIIEFDKKFRGFKRAYFAELRNQIGRNEFLKIRDSINEWMEGDYHFSIQP